MCNNSYITVIQTHIYINTIKEFGWQLLVNCNVTSGQSCITMLCNLVQANSLETEQSLVMNLHSCRHYVFQRT